MSEDEDWYWVSQLDEERAENRLLRSIVLKLAETEAVSMVDATGRGFWCGRLEDSPGVVFSEAEGDVLEDLKPEPVVPVPAGSLVGEVWLLRSIIRTLQANGDLGLGHDRDGRPRVEMFDCAVPLTFEQAALWVEVGTGVPTSTGDVEP